MAGVGLTNTLTVNELPGQEFVIGVTVYTADWAIWVGLTKVPETLEPLPAVPPVKPPDTVGAVHVYVVPARTTPLVPLTGVIENAVPPHVRVYSCHQ